MELLARQRLNVFIGLRFDLQLRGVIRPNLPIHENLDPSLDLARQHLHDRPPPPQGRVRPDDDDLSRGGLDVVRHALLLHRFSLRSVSFLIDTSKRWAWSQADNDVPAQRRATDSSPYSHSNPSLRPRRPSEGGGRVRERGKGKVDLPTGSPAVRSLDSPIHSSRRPPCFVGAKNFSPLRPNRRTLLAFLIRHSRIPPRHSCGSRNPGGAAISLR